MEFLLLTYLLSQSNPRKVVFAWVKEAEAQGAKELAQNLSKSEHQDVLLDSLILGPPSVSIP